MANLRVRDVAERLDVSSKTVYKWLREGLIPASRLGKSWIISEEALQAALSRDRTDRWLGPRLTKVWSRRRRVPSACWNPACAGMTWRVARNR